MCWRRCKINVRKLYRACKKDCTDFRDIFSEGLFFRFQNEMQALFSRIAEENEIEDFAFENTRTLTDFFRSEECVDSLLHEMFLPQYEDRRESVLEALLLVLFTDTELSVLPFTGEVTDEFTQLLRVKLLTFFSTEDDSNSNAHGGSNSVLRNSKFDAYKGCVFLEDVMRVRALVNATAASNNIAILQEMAPETLSVTCRPREYSENDKAGKSRRESMSETSKSYHPADNTESLQARVCYLDTELNNVMEVNAELEQQAVRDKATIDSQKAMIERLNNQLSGKWASQNQLNSFDLAPVFEEANSEPWQPVSARRIDGRRDTSKSGVATVIIQNQKQEIARLRTELAVVRDNYTSTLESLTMLQRQYDVQLQHVDSATGLFRSLAATLREYSKKHDLSNLANDVQATPLSATASGPRAPVFDASISAALEALLYELSAARTDYATGPSQGGSAGSLAGDNKQGLPYIDCGDLEPDRSEQAPVVFTKRMRLSGDLSSVGLVEELYNFANNHSASGVNDEGTETQSESGLYSARQVRQVLRDAGVAAAMNKSQTQEITFSTDDASGGQLKQSSVLLSRHDSSPIMAIEKSSIETDDGRNASPCKTAVDDGTKQTMEKGLVSQSGMKVSPQGVVRRIRVSEILPESSITRSPEAANKKTPSPRTVSARSTTSVDRSYKRRGASPKMEAQGNFERSPTAEAAGRSKSSIVEKHTAEGAIVRRKRVGNTFGASPSLSSMQSPRKASLERNLRALASMTIEESASAVLSRVNALTSERYSIKNRSSPDSVNGE